MKIKTNTGVTIDSNQPDELLASLAKNLVCTAINDADTLGELKTGDTFYFELNDANLLMCQTLNTCGPYSHELSIVRYNYGMGRDMTEGLAREISKLLKQEAIRTPRYDGSIITFNWYNLSVID